MESGQQDSFKDKLNNTIDTELCHLIFELNNVRKIEDDPFLKNWQKTCLMDAVASFYIGWFRLCRVNLANALEPIENISQDSFNVKKTNELASRLSESELDSDIQFICSYGSRVKT